MTTKTFLITGGTRGIGGSIVAILQADETNKIIVGVRDPNAPTAKELATKPNVTIVKIDSEDDESPFAAAKQLAEDGVDKIDAVFANAGIIGDASPLPEIQGKTMHHVFQVNTVAPLLLFQAFKPFLQKSDKPIFSVTSSMAGSISLQDKVPPFPYAHYNASKAAVNLIVRRIAVEQTWLNAFVVHPGVVTSSLLDEMIKDVATAPLIEQHPKLNTEESARRVVELVMTAQLATHSGRFFDVQNGGEVPW